MSTQQFLHEGNPDGPTLLLVHAHPDSPDVWDPVVELLSDRFRIVRAEADEFAAGLAQAAGDTTVHVLAHGSGSVAVWQYLTDSGASGRVASFTSAPGARAGRLRRLADGLGRLAKRAPAPGGASVDIPVQVIVAAGDRSRFHDEVAFRASRLWRRDVKAALTTPHVLARSVTQLVDHLDGAPAARELLRAEVGRPRAAFGDTLVAVTGAASGIGRETALAFAREGADIAISDVDTAGLGETARLVAAEGAQAFTYRVDVADADAVESFADQLCAEHGVPDIVVNNAGVGHAGFFLDTPAEEYDRVLDINFGGVVNGCRSFGKRLRDRGVGGHIVNVASMASYTPVNVMNAYCTSKAAVFMFSDCLRAELDSHGIGLTTICPGIIGTNIVNTTRFSLPDERSYDTETIRRRVRRGFAVRRVGPDKVAKAIVAAVKSNKPVRPVTTEAYLVYGAAHAAPQAMRSAARGGNIM
ncbi:SDR family oxidoreductase [Mycolicibacterium sp. BiH015]|uniref:SDR family oxidoreductase n=1 Tax=Mycolicibacterium sp. BiH015 TaxID=3018808 RepID=UPI0022E5F5A3|nr:SDR family oxidoreductase [Mycolicibacterium sp. BiH015]MDA2890376.1 SDR family oxidoreductase [Mycolicibacterium sp. BiH015]